MLTRISADHESCLTEGFNQSSQTNRIGHPVSNYTLNLILNCCFFKRFGKFHKPLKQVFTSDEAIFI